MKFIVLLIFILISCGKNPSLSKKPAKAKVPSDSNPRDENQSDQNDQTQADTLSLICRSYSDYLAQGVPKKPLQQVLSYYVKNIQSIKQKRYISIADYSQSSTKKRFYLLDMMSNNLERYKVSHGSGKIKGVAYADRTHNGFLDKCTHPRSIWKPARKHSRYAMTRPGFFLTAHRYLSGGSHIERRNSQGVVTRGWPYIFKSEETSYNALRLIGLNNGVNDRAMDQGVVMHGAWYNDSRNTGQDIMGRSFGCPAFEPDETSKVLNRIQSGSLYYSYVPQCGKDMKIVKKSINDWDSFCQ